ncbi:unnamed protein product [Ectocarpus sp. 6 AP-2014]
MSVETSSRILRAVSPGGVSPAVWSEFSRGYQALSPDETRSSNMCVRAGATMSTKRQGYQTNTEATEPQPTQQQLFRQRGPSIEAAAGGGLDNPRLKRNKPVKWSAEEDRRLRDAVVRFSEARWKDIASLVETRNHVQCLQRWKKVLKPGLVKGQWSAEEDDRLVGLVEKGFRNWGQVASFMDGRTSKQCRERWCHHLDPAVRKGGYTTEEDELIIFLQGEVGNRWADIAKRLTGRTENAVKIRWKALNRRQRDARNKAAAAAASPAAPTGHRLLPRPAAAGASNGPLSSSSSSSSLLSDAGGRGAVDGREKVRGMVVGPGGGGGGGKTVARASSTSSSSSSSSSSAAAAHGGGGSSSSKSASRRQKGGGGGARAALDTPAAASGVAGPGGMSMSFSNLPLSSSLADMKPNLTPAEAGAIHTEQARRSLSYPSAFAAASAATSSSSLGYPINDAAAGAAATCASSGRIDRPPGVGVGAGFQQESEQAVAGSCCGGEREGGEGKSGRQKWTQKGVGGEASSFDDRAPLTGSGLAAAAASAVSGSGMVPAVKGAAAPEGARTSPSRRYPFASGDGSGGGGGGEERPAGNGGKMEGAGAGDGGLHRLCAALANVEAMDNMHRRGGGAVAAAPAARTASSSRASPKRAELEGGGGGGKRSGRSTPSGEEEGQQQQQVGGKSPGAAAAAASRTKRARDDGAEVGKAQVSAREAAAAAEGGGSPSKVASPPAKRAARSPANTDAAVPTSCSPPAAAAAASPAAAPGAVAVADSLASHD